jgi:hypothetical protein
MRNLLTGLAAIDFSSQNPHNGMGLVHNVVEMRIVVRTTSLLHSDK